MELFVLSLVLVLLLILALFLDLILSLFRLPNLAKMKKVRHEILAKIFHFGIISQKDFTVRHLFQKFFAFGEKTLRFFKKIAKNQKVRHVIF